MTAKIYNLENERQKRGVLWNLYNRLMRGKPIRSCTDENIVYEAVGRPRFVQDKNTLMLLESLGLSNRSAALVEIANCWILDSVSGNNKYDRLREYVLLSSSQSVKTAWRLFAKAMFEKHKVKLPNLALKSVD